MNDPSTLQSDPNQIIAGLQAQISALQGQVNAAGNAYNTLLANNGGGALKACKPVEFHGKNVRSWIKSLENIFSSLGTPPEQEKVISYAVSYLTEDGLHWWELINISKEVNISTFAQFKEEILKYFEPVNREINAQKVLSTIKQMGNLNKISDYNIEFSKWLLRVPSMAEDERVLHYSQGLKHKLRIEIERSGVTGLSEAMRVADRMDNIYGRTMSPFYREGPSNGPVPMEVGNVPTRRRFVKLSPEEKQKLIKEKMCFVCKKAAVHR